MSMYNFACYKYTFQTLKPNIWNEMRRLPAQMRYWFAFQPSTKYLKKSSTFAQTYRLRFGKNQQLRDIIRAMPHAIQREAACYGLLINLTKTFLVRAGVARIAVPALKDISGQLCRTVAYIKNNRIRPRAGDQSKRNRVRVGWRCEIQCTKLVWRSALSVKQRIDRCISLVVLRGIWSLHLLALPPGDFAAGDGRFWRPSGGRGDLEYMHIRNLRHILRRWSAFFSRVSNDDILHLSSVLALASPIATKQLKLLGDWRIFLPRNFSQNSPSDCIRPCLNHKECCCALRCKARLLSCTCENIVAFCL